MPIEGRRLVVREDTRDILGFVSDEYKPMAPVDVFSEIIDPLASDFGMKFSSALSLDNGKSVSVVGTFNQPLTIHNPDGLKDDVIRKIVFRTKNDGGGSLRALYRAMRLVCTNGMVVPVDSSAIRIPHIGDTDEQIRRARFALESAHWNFEGMGDVYTTMMRKEMPDQDFNYFTNLVLKIDTNDTEKRMNRADDIADRWYHGEDIIPFGKTAYSAYQAVTGHLEHGKSFKDEGKRFKSLHFGASAKMNQTALGLAFAYTDGASLPGLVGKPEAKNNAVADGLSMVREIMKEARVN